MTVLWDMGARRAVGDPLAVRRDARSRLVGRVPVDRAGQLRRVLPHWVPWLLAYPKMKLDGWSLNPTLHETPWYVPSFLSGLRPPARVVRALVDYHRQMLYFHTNLTDPHPYSAKAVGWLLQVRPTAFWSLNDIKPGTDGCTAGTCVREVTSIGTPLLWWARGARAAVVRVALDRGAATGVPARSSAPSRPAGSRGSCSTTTARSSRSTPWPSRPFMVIGPDPAARAGDRTTGDRLGDPADLGGCGRRRLRAAGRRQHRVAVAAAGRRHAAVRLLATATVVPRLDLSRAGSSAAAAASARPRGSGRTAGRTR